VRIGEQAKLWDGRVVDVHQLRTTGGPLDDDRGEEWDGTCSACGWQARVVGPDAWSIMSREFLYHHGIADSGITIYREAPPQRRAWTRTNWTQVLVVVIIASIALRLLDVLR
jgi:hypothetical protein